MSTYRFEKLFSPQSIALVGASPRERSLGRIVLTKMHEADFQGQIHLVNPNYSQIDGTATAKSIEALPKAPDLVVITAPAPAVPGIVAAAGAKGCAGAIIMTSGLGHGPGSLSDATRQAALRHGLRIIGPNCLGVLVPGVHLNASFAARNPQAGDLALVSQSGAIVAGLVEWAARRSVGFSAVVSLGDQIDVDFGDLLDYFAVDRHTRAILLYIEAIGNTRKFMSAARAAARVKPVVVVKSGRHAQGARAAATHTGALAGSDAVYDAAFRRAGLLRVHDLDELFAAAETLGHLKPFPGKRLAILTNGGGVGVLAVDRLMDFGGTLAGISADTINRLDAVLPPIWSRSNPVDIAGDADASRYAAAFEALLGDPDNDAVLVMNVPTALASAADAANSVVAAARKYRDRFVHGKPVFGAWIGDDGVASKSFEAAGIPHYATETDAVRGFMHLVRYREALDALMETPPSLPADFSPDIATAQRIIRAVVNEGRAWLNPVEVAALLDAYSIPTTPVALARDADQAVAAAAPLIAEGETVALKILSPDIVHKSEVGGVRLNLANESQVREAASEILQRARTARPQARIHGLTVQPMILRPKARELIAGIADDPTFGPVIVFGRGGTAVEVIDDKALALPPLDLKLARELVARTRVARILKAYRDVPAADEHAVALVLVKLAQMAADLPELRELDLNPILADEAGVIAVDARVRVAPVEKVHGPSGHPRFAIRPYPKEWEKRTALRDGMPIFIRPIRPEDERLYAAFFAATTDEDLRLRFFAPLKERGHAVVARLTQLDYARAMAFIALDEAIGEMLGVVRLHADANHESAEFAVLVRSDFKGRGLGWILMQTMLEYARAEGLRTVEGQVLNENTNMLAMCRELGFTIAPDPSQNGVSFAKLAVT